jgi:hypothetical protein
MSIIIREDWRGSRGGTYYYVREGTILRRIDKYAISKKKVYESRRGPTYEYLVPVQRIREKEIYEFGFSNSGYPFFRKGGVEAFLNSLGSEYPWIPDYKLMRYVRSEELMNLEFEIEDPALLKLVRDIKKFYPTIVDEIKSYSRAMSFKIFFSGHAEATSTFLDDVNEGMMRCMVLQNDQARMKCLEKPISWIYQLWIMVLISKALMIEEFLKREYETETTWWIEQGKPYPAFIARSRENIYYTFFFEPQIHEMAHLTGAFIGTRIHVRPDIIITKGKYSSLKDIAEVDLLVECKTAPQEMWEKEILSQMKDYVEIYRAKTKALVSFYNVDPLLRRSLERIEVIPIDEVRPGGLGLEKFKIFVQKTLRL